MVQLPPERAAQAVRAAMRAIGVREIRPKRGHLEARTSLSVLSWGERILVDLAPGPGGTSVSVRSEPLLATTLFDCGHGQRLVESLLRAVYDLAHRPVA